MSLLSPVTGLRCRDRVPLTVDDSPEEKPVAYAAQFDGAINLSACERSSSTVGDLDACLIWICTHLDI